MTLHEKIDAILSDSVFGGRLWYIKRPQNEKAHDEVFGIWSIVGGSSFQTLEGDTDIAQARVQISIYSPECLGTKALVDTVAAVNAAMLAANELTDTADAETEPLALYNYSASVPMDGHEPETELSYTHMEFYCWI